MSIQFRKLLIAIASIASISITACHSRGVERLLQGNVDDRVQTDTLSSQQHRSQPVVESFGFEGRVTELAAGYKTVCVGDPVQGTFDIRFNATAVAVTPEHTVYAAALTNLKGHLGRFKFNDDQAYIGVSHTGWTVDTEPGSLDGTTLTYDLIMNRTGVYPDASLQNLRNLDKTRFTIRTLFFETQPANGKGILVTITRVEKRGGSTCQPNHDDWRS